ncbi:MAG: carboxypeptidase regulatory-like domain-containing protein, partial [Bryobacteraceae bacterium]
LSADKSLASFDTPDRMVISYVLDVPVGKGRKFLSNANRFVNATVGGWGIEGVTTFQSGFPLHLTTNSGNINSPGAGSQRPNVVAGCNATISGSATSRLNEWFNTSCFTHPSAFTYGDESRTDPRLRSAGIANFDFSAFKNFPILPDDRAHLQFRAEFFNLFNRVQFGYPGQALGASNFGEVTSQQNLPRLVQFALRLAF